MADVFGEETETEPTLTINEYLDEIEEQELEADLVLGGDEGKECTYSKGYMKRQAIFSCLTCTPDGNAGICTACSLSCHDGHEILELWTKRNFRCDCGNSKFGEAFCKLLANKDVENAKNSYNHNFKGAYCTCGRPYPDPDAETDEEMIQCCICEDWFHDSHLGLEPSEEVPRDDEGNLLYEDLICQACSAVCSFMTLYPNTIFVSVKRQDAASSAKKQKGVAEVQFSSACTARLDNDAGSSEPVEVNDAVPSVMNGCLSREKELVSAETSEKLTLNICSHHVNSSTACILGLDLRVAAPAVERSKAMFLAVGWRDSLCRCEACMDVYNQKGIGFLLDKDDSVAEYEKMAKQKREENLQQQEGVELNFLNKLGHVEKMEVLSGIADMKNELQAFLASHDTSKPITAADIHDVFDNIKKRRREL